MSKPPAGPPLIVVVDPEGVAFDVGTNPQDLVAHLEDQQSLHGGQAWQPEDFAFYDEAGVRLDLAALRAGRLVPAAGAEAQETPRVRLDAAIRDTLARFRARRHDTPALEHVVAPAQDTTGEARAASELLSAWRGDEYVTLDEFHTARQAQEAAAQAGPPPGEDEPGKTGHTRNQSWLHQAWHLIRD